MMRRTINEALSSVFLIATTLQKVSRKVFSKFLNEASNDDSAGFCQISIIDVLEVLEQNADLGDCRVIFIHSAFKGLGSFKEKPPEILAELKKWIGEDGLLVFPAFTMQGTQEAAISGVDCVDLDKAKITTGVLPGFSAKDHDFQRSNHPTHSITACGSYSTDLSLHGQDGTATGKSSIFWELIQRKALVVNLGTTLNETTLVHAYEEIQQEDFVFKSVGRPKTVSVKLNGEINQKTLKPLRARLSIIRDVNRLKAALISTGAMREIKFGRGVIQLISARGMYAATEECNQKEGSQSMENSFHYLSFDVELFFGAKSGVSVIVSSAQP